MLRTPEGMPWVSGRMCLEEKYAKRCAELFLKTEGLGALQIFTQSEDRYGGDEALWRAQLFPSS